MTFINTVNTIIDPILEKIIAHPFLDELSKGTLDQKIYHFYLIQDYYYLTHYTKALSQLANTTSSITEKNFFHECAEICSHEPAFEIHDSVLNHKIPLTKACSDYIQFIKIHTENSYRTGVAAVFPCFYVYFLVAKKLNPDNLNNPYQSWFDIYTGDLFVAQNEVIINFLEKIYLNCNQALQKQLLEIIKEGAELEWRFWDESYGDKF